jgi:hypothetical protein
MNGTARQIRCREGERTEEPMPAIAHHIQEARFLFFSFQECSARENIDKLDIPDIGVATIIVDGKPLKDDTSMTLHQECFTSASLRATELRLARRNLQSRCQPLVPACNFPVLPELAEISRVQLPEKVTKGQRGAAP